VVVAVVVSAGLAAPAAAKQEARCNPGQETLRIEQKTCPATALRPPIVLERACCLHRNGKMRCEHFPHCPKRSPS
jgi:hypothetical protein